VCVDDFIKNRIFLEKLSPPKKMSEKKFLAEIFVTKYFSKIKNIKNF
jgi:hypothetical protein